MTTILEFKRLTVKGSKSILSNVRFILFVALFYVMPVGAQLPSYLSDRPPAELVRDAFSTSYGNILTTEFRNILAESMDEKCVVASKLNAGHESLDTEARRILIKFGTKYLENYNDAFNISKFESAFMQKAGSEAKQEYVQLLTYKNVQDLNKISEVRRFAIIANSVVDFIGRGAHVSRLGLKRGISPYSSGKQDLLAASDLALSTKEIDRFIDLHPSQELRRWQELSNAAKTASSDAFNIEKTFFLWPSYLTAELRSDLLKLCVLSKVR